MAGQFGKDGPVGDTLKSIIRSAGLERRTPSWGAYVPDLPGVITVGDSRGEMERLINEAIEFHLEGMREEGISVPPPSSFAGVVEIDHAV